MEELKRPLVDAVHEEEVRQDRPVIDAERIPGIDRLVEDFTQTDEACQCELVPCVGR